MFDKNVYITRRNKLRSLVKSGIIVILGNSESPANYPANTYHFRQDSNFRYFFGLGNPDFVGVMDVDAGTDCLYGEDCTLDDVIWMGPQPALKELAAQVGIGSSFSLRDLTNVVASAIRKGRKVHFLPPYRAENVRKIGNLLGIQPEAVPNYVSKELIRGVVSLREIKEQPEIDEIDLACEIGYKMHTTAMKMCRPGIVERQIAGTIEGIALAHGAGVSFHSIVSEHGETLHNHFHGNTLQAGRLLLVDAGAETTLNYCSDFTRTMPISGKFTTKQRDIYNIALAANNRAIQLIRPGITYQEIHLQAVKVLAQGLMDIGLLKGNLDEAVANGVPALFMPHGLGHQMGLDVHDMEDLGEKYVGYDQETERSTQFGLASLRMGKRLKEGVVLTVEPGIYFIPALIQKWREEQINTNFINFAKLEEYLDFGGIRIEDDILVQSGGNRLLGKKRAPVTVEEIENYMAK